MLFAGAVVGGGAARAQTPPPKPAPGPGKAAAPAAEGDWTKMFSLTLELGPGDVITSYNANPTPNTLLFMTGVRAGYDFAPGWSGILTLRQWWLPSEDHALMFGPGVRFDPYELWAGRVYVDGSVGPVSTRNNWTVGLDVGGGIEWDIPDAPGLALGPYLRVGYVANPNDNTNDDGSAWSVGASINYHFGRGSEAGPGTVQRKRGPFKVTIPDTDRDGIGDDRDECRSVPVGKHPDQFKVGCPESDEDEDGIPDSSDPCPVVAPGDTPDPKRPGCPIIDTDGDGVPDAEDACPAKKGAASSDPTHSGCPMKKEGGAKEEPAEAPATPEGIAPVKTRKRAIK